MSCDYPIMSRHTCYNLWALKILVGMDVAGPERKVDAHAEQQQVATAPHHVDSGKT